MKTVKKIKNSSLRVRSQRRVAAKRAPLTTVRITIVQIAVIATVSYPRCGSSAPEAAPAIAPVNIIPQNIAAIVSRLMPTDRTVTAGLISPA